MLHVILKITMWILILLLVVLVAFWVYGMITSKEFRDANIESARKAQREREWKRKRNRPYESEYYKRTGCRNFLSRGGGKI